MVIKGRNRLSRPMNTYASPNNGIKNILLNVDKAPVVVLGLTLRDQLSGIIFLITKFIERSIN